MYQEWETLVENYKPLAYRVASSYHTLPYEDRRQEALVGLIVAAQKFDPERGAFGPYARRVIQSRLNWMYRSERLTVPFEEHHEPEFVANFDATETKAAFMAFTKLLDPFEYAVLKHKAKRLTQRQIASALGCGQATVCRVLMELRVKWDNFMEGYDELDGATITIEPAPVIEGINGPGFKRPSLVGNGHV